MTTKKQDSIMKSLEITTKKRLLIVEYATEVEFETEIGLLKHLTPSKIINFGHILEFICSGSDLTEEIAQGMVQESKYMNYAGESGWVDYKVYPDGLIFGAIESFISSVEAQGWYWGENPKGEQPHNTGLIYQYPTKDPLMNESLKKAIEWRQFESRTFHPERVIIFEIVEA